MDLLKAIVYGVIQGLTEWLPISSTAHLRIIPALLGWRDPGAAFTATIQLGTTLAVIFFFWQDLSATFSAWIWSFSNKELRKTPEAQIGWGVFLGTIPIVIVGFLLKDHIETTFRSLYVVSGALVFFGVVMLWADRRKVGSRDMRHVRTKDVVTIGFWQCLALIPGVSRSGSTLTGSFIQGLDRPTAARLSFLLSMPSITAAGIYEAIQHRHEILEQDLYLVLVSTLVAFFVGLASIAWFIDYIRKHDLRWFVAYRILLGVLILGLSFMHLIPAEAKENRGNPSTAGQTKRPVQNSEQVLID